MKLPIIAEGPLNTALMQRLVECNPRLQGDLLRLIEEEGHYGVSSRAHTIMSLRRMPAALVVNTDSDPETPYVQRWLMELNLGDTAPSCEWQLVLFEPNGEGWLMRQPGVLHPLLPVEPTPEQMQRARTEPRKVLAELFAQVGEPDFTQGLIKRLPQVDLSALWATKDLRRLEEFLLEKQELLLARLASRRQKAPQETIAPLV
jgi:hypothetical protein